VRCEVVFSAEDAIKAVAAQRNTENVFNIVIVNEYLLPADADDNEDAQLSIGNQLVEARRKAGFEDITSLWVLRHTVSFVRALCFVHTISSAITLSICFHFNLQNLISLFFLLFKWINIHCRPMLMTTIPDLLDHNVV
jgi:hypothetical protein